MSEQTPLDIAAEAALFVCHDCHKAENYEGMCCDSDAGHIIGGKIICTECADEHHKGEGRQPIPSLPVAASALKLACNTLETLTDPDSQNANIPTMFHQCIAAARKARKAIWPKVKS